MPESQPLIAIVMSSLSDYDAVKPGVDLIEGWGVPYEILVASAHRTPERVARWAATAEIRGLQVIIAASGMAGHLPSAVASRTQLPVIGIPIETGALQGTDALFSIVQMPSGVPVAAVGINAGVNAALLAVQILARHDARWLAPLNKYRREMPARIDQQNGQLKIERPGAIWSSLEEMSEESPLRIVPRTKGSREAETEEPPEPKPERPTRPPASKKNPTPAESKSEQSAPPKHPPSSRTQGPRIGRVKIDADLMPIELIEQAVDCLLEGGVLALPTDTVYGLAVDATNVEAVQKLFALKERSPNRSIAIFIDSQRTLNSIAKNLTPDVRSMLEAFWPGPLTVVFEKQGRVFNHVAPGATIGIRIPDHPVPLTLMQELRRPLACTSANLRGQVEAQSADEVEEIFDGSLDLILDGGTLEAQPASTVIDVTEVPYRVLREGSITRTQLAAVVGDLIQMDEGENQ